MIKFAWVSTLLLLSIVLLVTISCCCGPQTIQPSADLQDVIGRTVDAWVTPRLLIDPDHFYSRSYRDGLDAWSTSLWNVDILREAIKSSQYYNNEALDPLIIDEFDKIE